MVDPDMEALIIDNGSHMMKVGFAGDDSPRAVFPTIVGRLRNIGIMVGMDFKDWYVGDEALSGRGRRGLNLKYPVERGMVMNWNDMEKIWHHSFYNELRVTPEEHPVILTEPALNPKNNREKTCSIQFETFGVPALCLAKQPILNLFSAGLVEGCQVDMGGGQTCVTQVFGGMVIDRCVKKMSFGGEEITKYLVKILGERGYEMTTSAEREIVRDIKETLGWVAEDYENELVKRESGSYCEHEYELPDGSKMTIGTERFRAAEVYFRPALMGEDEPGLGDLICKGIQHKDFDLEMKKMLASQIVVSGGSCCFEGMLMRIKQEAERGLGQGGLGRSVKVCASEARKFGTWMGATIVSDLKTFGKNWIVKDDYDEYGPTIVHRKSL